MKTSQVPKTPLRITLPNGHCFCRSLHLDPDAPSCFVLMSPVFDFGACPDVHLDVGSAVSRLTSSGPVLVSVTIPASNLLGVRFLSDSLLSE